MKAFFSTEPSIGQAGTERVTMFCKKKVATIFFVETAYPEYGEGTHAYVNRSLYAKRPEWLLRLGMPENKPCCESLPLLWKDYNSGMNMRFGSSDSLSMYNPDGTFVPFLFCPSCGSKIEYRIGCSLSAVRKEVMMHDWEHVDRMGQKVQMR